MYAKIAKEFRYSKQLDYEASMILDSVAGRTISDKSIAALIRGKTVFVVGAGTSLGRAVSTMKRFKEIVKIAADSAAKPLLGSGIIPEVIVTDLDGDIDALKRCGAQKTVFAVHAHGDNISRLHLARSFKYRIGTTQTKPYGTVRNFGGFTDGDRAVFLASHFKARRIVLFGMDYDGMIGRFSATKKSEARVKLKKLKKSKELLEWLAGRTDSELFTTSYPIRGFKKITYGDLGGIV